MPLINWTPDLSVGRESIDTDHQVLIGLINELDDAIRVNEPRQTVCRVLDSLLDYTDYHFGREEVLMEACGYPDRDAHVRTHDMLRAQVADIRSRYHRSPESIHAREVLAFLKNWLTAHILGRDKLYAPFMAGKAGKVDEADRSYAEEMGRKLGDGTAPAGKVG
ncbi:MAG: bacteriohemerythrin [Rhodospirillales bacterium]